MFVKSTKVTQLQDRGRYVSPSLKVVNSRHIWQQARSEAKPPRLQRKSKMIILWNFKWLKKCLLTDS